MSESIVRRASEPQEGMTLEELEHAVAQAKAIGLAPASKVKADVGWSGKVKQLTITQAGPA